MAILLCDLYEFNVYMAEILQKNSRFASIRMNYSQEIKYFLPMDVSTDSFNNPVKVFSLSDWRITWDTETRLRFTVGMCGMFFCRKGTAVVELDEQQYTLSQGYIGIYMASALLRILQVSDDIEGIIVEADVMFILPLSKRIMSESDILFIRNNPVLQLQADAFQHIDRSLDLYQYRRNSHVGEDGSSRSAMLKTELMKTAGEMLLYELMLVYFSHREVTSTQYQQKDKVFQKFMFSLFSNYRKQRDVEFYAREQNLSPRYFSSLIKEETGRTALQWITQIVISEARQLLENTPLSVKEIAVKLNFCNQSFFGKYFKQSVGLSPSDYRQQLLRGTSVVKKS